MFLDDECKCTSKYNIMVDGKLVEAYCSKWESGDEKDWCYLTNGLDASSCPGAKKSGEGDFYYSSHEDVCRGKETPMQGTCPL